MRYSFSSSGIYSNNMQPRIFKCNTCGWEVPTIMCKSSQNGNNGWLFASCNLVSKDGAVCTYFRWASASPTSMPIVTQQATLASALPVPQSLPRPTPAPTVLSPPLTIAAAATTSCSLAGCWKHLHPECKCRVCKQHCVACGSCCVNTHGSTTIMSKVTLFRMMLMAPPLCPCLLAHHPQHA